MKTMGSSEEMLDIKKRADFHEEISRMLYGFGDGATPNQRTVLVIQSLVLHQLQRLLQEASELCNIRGKNTITNYEIIYLMHRDKNVLKIKRLYDYQVAKNEIDFITYGYVEFIEKFGSVRRRKKTHLEVIHEIDKNAEVEKIKYDYLGHMRKIRAKNATDAMSPESYGAYQEARCTSFRGDDNFTRFETWLNPIKLFKISTLALEVLSFIGHETIADIVDAVLLTRHNFSTGHSVSSTYNMQLVDGVLVHRTISYQEVNHVLQEYFTPMGFLNDLFYKNIGLEYLSSIK